jgi:hypothetical protein
MNTGKTPQIADYYSDLQTPSVDDLKVNLDQLVQQGTISPEQAQTILQDPSKLNDIQTDPALKDAQMSALSSLQDIGKGGLTDTDLASLNKIKTNEDTASRGKREAILQNAQARGLGGSGLELMAQLQNQQDSVTNQSQRDMDVAALAKQRSLDALIQGGSLAGNIQNQSFNQQAQVANANDAISKFNAANKQNQINTNVAANNAAQASNLANKQDIANQNVGIKNTQQQYNKNLLQQNFQNELAKRGGQAGLAGQNAQIQGQNNATQAAANNALISTGAGVATGGLGYLAAQEAAKKKQQGVS